MNIQNVRHPNTHRKAGDNRLTFLAAEIQIEHKAVTTALSSAVIHAMACGDLLAEAKTKVGHGGWLAWCEENCPLSERSIQLYTKLAKNRATIEKHLKSATGVADLTLNEAAALCVLAGRIEKVLEFAKRCETCSPDDLVNLCVQYGFTTIVDEGYDPFAGRSEIEQRDWILFGWFIGNGSESAFDHVEWLLQRPFQNVEEWLGPEGDRCRRNWGMKPVPDKCRTAWKKFHTAHAHMTEADIKTELEKIRAEHYAEHGWK